MLLKKKIKKKKKKKKTERIVEFAKKHVTVCVFFSKNVSACCDETFIG